MARAVETCVHCGFCLPSCPTYRVLGEEMDSPRGRIVLMKQVLEGDLRANDVLPYIDRCLGCLGCETSCPSGVRYRDLLIPFAPAAALTLAATGGVREIDAGDLHGSLFFNVAGIGFDAPDNAVTLVTRNGERQLAKASKDEIAAGIVDEVERLLEERRGSP